MNNNAQPNVEAAGKASRETLLGIFFLSLAVLMVEVLESRIFAFILWHHLGFMVISIAMLGLSAAGSYLALRSEKLLARRQSVFLVSALGFSLTLLVGHFAISRMDLGLSFAIIPALGVLYLLCFLPFLAAGIGLALPFRLYPGDSARIYTASMVGSGLGTILVMPALTALGAERSLALAAAFGALAAVLFSAAPRPRDRRALTIGACGLVLALAFIPVAGRVIVFHSFSTKLMGLYLKKNPQAKLETTGWTPYCRIDVVDMANESVVFGSPSPSKIVFQDGDEPTSILQYRPGDNLADLAERTPHAAGYLVKPHPDKMLIIGPGGGMEAHMALYHRSPDITCVEINPLTIGLVKGKYAGYTDDVYRKPGIRMVNAEGRSFLSRTHETYDLITLNGVDTYTSLASGAYVLTESYLYTEEAMAAYLDHLKPDGAVAFYRLQQKPPRETLRLVMIMVRALQNRGVKNPQAHFILLERLNAFNMIVSNHPFTRAELDDFRARFASTNVKILYDDPFTGFKQSDSQMQILYTPDRPGTDAYSRFLLAVAAGSESTYFAGDPYFDSSRITDDSPYFFKYSVWDMFIGGPRMRLGTLLILVQLLQTLLLTAVFIILPLRKLPRATVPRAARFRTLVYFTALGAGYILVEVVLMQKLVLLLGNPTYSLSITLSSLLLSSGMGAIWVERKQAWTGRNGAAAVAAGLVVLFLAGPLVTGVFLGQAMPLRLAASWILILPVGFLMGTPFPAGLKAVSRLSPDLVSWSWSVNGAASVIASIICVPLAMNFNFTTVLAIAIALYLAAAATAKPAPRE